MRFGTRESGFRLARRLLKPNDEIVRLKMKWADLKNIQAS